jgi:hypothetical protein
MEEAASKRAYKLEQVGATSRVHAGFALVVADVSSQSENTTGLGFS